MWKSCLFYGHDSVPLYPYLHVILLNRVFTWVLTCSTVPEQQQTILQLWLMVGHLFQNYDTVYVRFLPTYTCNFSNCMGFYPMYVTIFSSYVRSTHTYQKRTPVLPNICALQKPIYMRAAQVCVYVRFIHVVV